MTGLGGRFSGYGAFLRACLSLLGNERHLVLCFMALSLLAGLTEGFGITLLVPILTAAAPHGGDDGTAIFSSVANMFAGLSPAERIQLAALAMMAVVVARGLMQYGVTFLSSYIPARLERRLAISAYGSMTGVSLAFMHRHDDGVLLNGLTNWVFKTVDVLNGVATAVWTSILLAVYLVLMLAISWQMTLSAGMLLFSLSLLVRYITSKPLSQTGAKLDGIMAAINQMALESLNGAKLIRLQAAEDRVVARFATAYDRYVDVRRYWYAFMMLPGQVVNVGTGLFICVALILSQTGEGAADSAVSRLIVFLFVLSRLNAPVAALNDARARIVSNLPFFDNLRRFIAEMIEQRQPSGSRLAEPLARGITIERLDFGYLGGAPVIHDLNLSIAKGEMVAVVGPSGAGKSTLVGLLTRLHEPVSGRILVDGVPLAELDVRSWRRRIGVVSQDSFLFNDTVAANIAFGIPEATPEAIRQAAGLAAAAEFIESLPQGYETVLGDRGVRLSGGQQQRMSIARAILANPDLFILDEATSHLDTYSERAIQEAVERLARDRTVLVIAHRLSTIRRADRVVVMMAGRVVEMGRHDELMARRGVYWDMVTHQQLDLVEQNPLDCARVDGDAGKVE